MAIICYFWFKVERKLVANQENTLASIQIQGNHERKRNSIHEMVRRLRSLSFQPSLTETPHSMVEIRIDIPPVFHQKTTKSFKPTHSFKPLLR